MITITILLLINYQPDFQNFIITKCLINKQYAIHLQNKILSIQNICIMHLFYYVLLCSPNNTFLKNGHFKEVSENHFKE